jgi:hypothetical protein
MKTAWHLGIRKAQMPSLNIHSQMPSLNTQKSRENSINL